MMHRKWTIIAPFFRTDEDRWLDDFIENTDIDFRKIPPPDVAASWHSGTRKVTSWQAWYQHMLHARQALRENPYGIICSFPQLAMCTALWRKLSWSKPAIVAYNYNLGGFPKGWRRRIARWVASEVSYFVVHSPSEVETYAVYLGVSQDRIRFVPLQHGKIDLTWKPNEKAPYILAMGSAHRDYASLIRAVDDLGVPTVIITRASDVAALPQSDYVTFKSDLTMRACLELMSQARISVTPVANLETASGQVTFVVSMHMGVPVIATDCPGTEGYIEHGRTGLLVPPFDAGALADAISSLWNDEPARNAMSTSGQQEARARFTDEAAAKALLEILEMC